MNDNYQSTFGGALVAIQDGRRVARRGWNGKDMFIALQLPDENSKMKRPYIYMSPVDGLFVPWAASTTDLLTNDWFVLPE